MKKEILRDQTLVDLFIRMVEVSGAVPHNYTVNQTYDATSARSITAYALMEYGFLDEVPFVGPPTEEEIAWGFFYDCPSAPPTQLLKIEIQSIWGHSIKVTDFITNQLIMECYFDNGWARRDSLLKPQNTLRRLLWEAEFVNEETAEIQKATWYDEPFEDPMGGPSDYI